MESETLDDLTHVLQLSITPVALISGVALLLLSMTNRLGRVIDRARVLERYGSGHGHARSVPPPPGAPQHEPTGAGDDPGAALRPGEKHILWRRARYLLLSIALISISIFLSVVMVAALFVMTLSGAALGTVVLVLFGACLACLVASISYFLGDILLSIRWLRVSLGGP